MTDKEAADEYRLAQAKAIMDAYERDTGHPVHDIEDLDRWAGENPEKAQSAASNPYSQPEDN